LVEGKDAMRQDVKEARHCSDSSAKWDSSKIDGTQRSNIINCTKALAKQNSLKLLQKFIVFRKFTKPTALIIQSQKSERRCKVGPLLCILRAALQTQMSAILTDVFGDFLQAVDQCWWS
jgi:hypothetical protein